MRMPGPMELILIILIILLLFGAKKVPEITRSLATAIKEFKKAGKSLSEGENEGESEKRQDPS